MGFRWVTEEEDEDEELVDDKDATGEGGRDGRRARLEVRRRSGGAWLAGVVNDRERPRGLSTVSELSEELL